MRVLLCMLGSLVGCMGSDLVPCAELLCAEDQICDPTHGCVYAEQVIACAANEGGDCSYLRVTEGACVEGLCIPRGCGNGKVTPDEACDDGNNRNADGCSADCGSDETCGNGVVDVDVGERCDRGGENSQTPDADCRLDCRVRRCGDGVADTSEACDDGNTMSGDGCADDCQSTEACGNAIVDPGEQCDDGGANSNAPDASCRLDCTRARCGDGVLDTGELCDGPELGGQTCAGFGFDGGVLQCGAFCSFSVATCTGYCGDGVRDADELCDGADYQRDGAAATTCALLGRYPSQTSIYPICNQQCQPVLSSCGGFCGDGIRNPSYEACEGGDWAEETSTCDYHGNGAWTGEVRCIGCQPDASYCTCGDSTCDPWETCSGSGTGVECEVDCGACCGNGSCDPGEACGQGRECTYDCGSCCGDGVCDSDEAACESNACGIDCSDGPCCGDNTCDSQEECGGAYECSQDCGPC